MRLCLLALLLALSTSPAWAEGLPIRVDSSRNGKVYIQKVDGPQGFELLGTSTPATYTAKPGERVDVKVVAEDGFFVRWQGFRQNVAGPCNITIRLERGLAWERIALTGGAILTLFLFVLFKSTRKAKQEVDVAKSQIIQLKERAATAEMVGALARTLGEYEVLDKLGAGAMGVVYKVKNSGGDIFAAKVPNEMDERVKREAEVSAALKSPNIVECYGLVEGDQQFLLLEYLDGQTVHEWLEFNRDIPLETIDEMVRQVLEALDVAHSQGVYHRDIKPENMFLAKEGDKLVLKIMDFGLASSINAARLTRTGEAMGTPIYASPEQLSGNPVDATTDLYSVGVFIFELATGLLPWNQTDPVALTLSKYKPLPNEPIVKRPDLPMAWNQLVVDLLSGDPQKRPRTVAAVKERWAEGCKRVPRR